MVLSGGRAFEHRGDEGAARPPGPIAACRDGEQNAGLAPKPSARLCKALEPLQHPHCAPVIATPHSVFRGDPRFGICTDCTDNDAVDDDPVARPSNSLRLICRQTFSFAPLERESHASRPVDPQMSFSDGLYEKDDPPYGICLPPYQNPIGGR